MTARTAYRELKNLMKPIDEMQKSWAAKPPSWGETELRMVCVYFSLCFCSTKINVYDSLIVAIRLLVKRMEGLYCMGKDKPVVVGG